MKGFERRQIKKSLTLPLLHLTSSIFSSVCLTFACVLCCAALVLLLCVALTINGMDAYIYMDRDVCRDRDAVMGLVRVWVTG